MKRYQLIIRATSVLLFIITIGFVCIAPDTVVTHYGETGADAFGYKGWLFFNPILYAAVGECLIYLGKRIRRREKMEDFPFFIEWELKSFAACAFLFVIFVGLLINQVGLAHF